MPSRVFGGKGKTVKISEIFYSLQGESSYAGYPFAFVRTAGCPLHCAYCDSPYARQGGEELTPAEVLARVRNFGFHPVLVTGGEPLAQPEVHDLIGLLLGEGRTVLLETGGSLPIEAVDPAVVRILDVKCPGSGQADRNWWPNLDCLRAQDEVKFVLCSEPDYLFSREVIARHGLLGKCQVLLSAAQGYLSPRDLAAWILRDGLGVRLQIQLHKYLWPEISRGV